MLMRGEIPDIGKDAPPVLQKLCLLMRTRLLRPKVIVEYDRVPYIYPQGNVRITLDENIRAIIFVRRWNSRKWEGKTFTRVEKLLKQTSSHTT